jgi:predicted glycoside hydrolase/deacetylase ChbG (UPF0249 family)
MSGGTTRVLALCADDFGLAPGISRGIAELAQRERLQAVSCLTNAGHWRSDAALLRGLPASVETGLHFNLTEGAPASAELAARWPVLPSLERLIVLAHLRRLPRAALAAELAAQWQGFADATGRAPAFVDGHQHVHHLPVVREIVLQGLARHSPPPAVRNTGRIAGPGFQLKRWLIAGTGGRRLLQALKQRRIAHNPALTGVYDFVPGRYRQRMQQWLAALPADGALLFCHPGAPDTSGVADPIAAARVDEARYLGSDEFSADLRAAGVRLGRVW